VPVATHDEFASAGEGSSEELVLIRVFTDLSRQLGGLACYSLFEHDLENGI
jgi:hypothetical protein